MLVRITSRPTRHALALLATIALSTLAQRELSAQPSTPRRFELRPFAGAMIQTGEQRGILDDAFLTGLQASWRPHRHLALTGSVSWAASADRQGWGTPTAGKGSDVDIFQYDLGVEGRLPGAWGGASWSVSPFGTLGVGGRTYHYRDVEAFDAETAFQGFAGAGMDVGPREKRWGVRLEARDYVSAFKGLRGERAQRKARNDVQLMAGLTIAF